MRARSTLIDTLKIVASQLIVWHHLSVYSPMARQLEPQSPALFDFLFEQGRLVVQCFLVIAGFLAAQTALAGRAVRLGQAIVSRYVRLAPQFAVALSLVVLVTVGVQSFYQPAWMSALPSLWAFMAHVLMLQGVLDVPALSAGAWYVAIDFQLYVSFALLLWLLPCHPSSAPHRGSVAAVAALTAASWWGFNRVGAWDVWAPYFWGAYGLGVLAAWSRASRWAGGVFAGLVVLLMVEAFLDFHSRPLLAALTAFGLWCIGERDVLSGRLRHAWRLLSEASYAIFLGHFAVILGVSAVWSVTPIQDTRWAWAFALVAWAASVLLGLAMNRWVKTPKAWTGALRGESVHLP